MFTLVETLTRLGFTIKQARRLIATRAAYRAGFYQS